MPGDLWEMPWLTLTLSFPCRAESEAPHRPTSPKVSRSPPEAAAPAEETARRSEVAVGGDGAGTHPRGTLLCRARSALCSSRD